MIAAERYHHTNFSLFSRLCAEAARNLGIHRWQQDEEKTIILPPTDLAAERLSAHLAVAPSGEPTSRTAQELRAARKMIRLEKKGQPCLFSGGVK
jgi:hypothetical protein